MKKELTAVSAAIGIAISGSYGALFDYSQGKVSNSRTLLATAEMSCGKEMKQKMEKCKKLMEEAKCGKEMKECQKIMDTKKKAKEMACGKCGSMAK